MFGVPYCHLHHYGDDLKPGISLNTVRKRKSKQEANLCFENGTLVSCLLSCWST